MSQPPIIVECRKYVKEICHKHNIGAHHGYTHAKEVAFLANRICREFKLTEEQRINVILASLMHDIDDTKFFPGGEYANALLFLDRLDRPNRDIILRMIKLVSFSTNRNDVDPNLPKYYYIPRDSDRVHAGGSMGIERTVRYTESVNRPLILSANEVVGSLEELKTACDQEAKSDPTTLMTFYKTNWFRRNVIASGSRILTKLANDNYNILALWVVAFTQKYKNDLALGARAYNDACDIAETIELSML